MNILSPAEIHAAAADAGERKASLTRGSRGRLMLSAFMAGCFVAFGGIFSVIIGQGFPAAAQGGFPALPRLLAGLVFPVGLTMVVVLGAELFTGNNAIMVTSFLSRRHSFADVLVNWGLVYAGNFAGAVAFAAVMVVACGLTAPEPYHSGIIAMAQYKTSMPWMTVFIKGVGANWCVCLALWLAMSGRTLLEKALGCWLPVMMFVVLGYEHSIANMFFIPCGMMEGAQVGVGAFLWRNLVPATLGNIVGGAVLVACVQAWLYAKK